MNFFLMVNVGEEKCYINASNRRVTETLLLLRRLAKMITEEPSDFYLTLWLVALSSAGGVLAYLAAPNQLFTIELRIIDAELTVNLIITLGWLLWLTMWLSLALLWSILYRPNRHAFYVNGLLVFLGGFASIPVLSIAVAVNRDVTTQVFFGLSLLILLFSMMINDNLKHLRQSYFSFPGGILYHIMSVLFLFMSMLIIGDIFEGINMYGLVVMFCSVFICYENNVYEENFVMGMRDGIVFSIFSIYYYIFYFFVYKKKIKDIK